MALRPAEIALEETTYAAALARTQTQPRHLVLGNGFSIAAHRDFAYEALVHAGGHLSERLQHIFDQVQTSDFEAAIKSLQDAAAIASFYIDDPDAFDRMAADVEAIKRRLVEAIAAVHPAVATDIAEERKLACVAFLKAFLRPEHPGVVFTTSYDLLLYWVAARYFGELGCHDGFGGPDLRWSAERPHQNLFWLHGGLHLFTTQDGIHKMRWRDVPLIEEIQNGLRENRLPLFVSEGDSSQKLDRIGENAYLSFARERYIAACQDGDAALLLFGSALKEQDQHILDPIGRGRVPAVFIGINGGTQGRVRDRAADVARQWKHTRRQLGLPELYVGCFDSRECDVWGTGALPGPAPASLP